MTLEQLEQQAERDRAAVTDTLEELQDRLSPGEIVDQVLYYMKDGGNEFMGNFGRQVTANPMPVVLVGAGLAWFLLGKSGTNGNGHATSTYTGARPSGMGGGYPTGRYTGDYSSRPQSGSGMGQAASRAANTMGDAASSAASGVKSAMHSVGDAASSAASGVGSAMQSVGEGVSNTLHSVSDGVADTMHSVGDAASNAYYQASDSLSIAKDRAMEMEQKAVNAARSTMAFVQEQPLILAGMGLALGAAIGAALPATDLENRLMGEASDEMKEAAKDLAVDQLDKAKEVGHKLGDALDETITSAEEEIKTEEMPIGAYAPQDGSQPRGNGRTF